jgi:hypothetical protein
MSKRTSRRMIVTFMAVGALLSPAFAESAHAQTPSKNIIDVDPATGTISRGLVLVAGAGNFVTVSVIARAAAPFLAVPTTGSGYAAGELVVPNGGFVTVPIYASNGSLASNIRVWDAKTTNSVLPPDLVGSAANLAVSATSKGVTKPLGAWVLDQLYLNPAKNVTTAIRVFDYRTDPNIIKAPDVLGTAANLSQPVASNGVERPLALWIYDQIGAPPPGVALATSFPKPTATVTVPVAPVPVAPISPAPISPAPVAPAPVTPGAPASPAVIPTPPVVVNPAQLNPAQLNPAPSPGSVTQPAAILGTNGVGQPRPVSLSTGTKTCIKSTTKFVKVGKKRVRRSVCVKYRTRT